MTEDPIDGAAKALFQESDRECVIFGAQILCDGLRDLLRAYFCQQDPAVERVVRKLFLTYAPLSTFSARIEFAFALGLLSKRVYRQLQIIRRMRNAFAHDGGPLDFTDPACQDRLNQLIGQWDDDLRADQERRPIGYQLLTKHELYQRSAFTVLVVGLHSHFLVTQKILEHAGPEREKMLAAARGHGEA